LNFEFSIKLNKHCFNSSVVWNFKAFTTVLRGGRHFVQKSKGGILRCYATANRHKGLWRKLQYINIYIYSLVRFVTCRCLDVEDSRKINLKILTFFGECIWGFSKTHCQPWIRHLLLSHWVVYLQSSFAYMGNDLRIYLTLIVTNCIGERSFSKRKMVEW